MDYQYCARDSVGPRRSEPLEYIIHHIDIWNSFSPSSLSRGFRKQKETEGRNMWGRKAKDWLQEKTQEVSRDGGKERTEGGMEGGKRDEDVSKGWGVH